MKIQNRVYVAIDYTLESDEVVDPSEPGRPFGFIFGTTQYVLPIQFARTRKFSIPVMME